MISEKIPEVGNEIIPIQRRQFCGTLASGFVAALCRGVLAGSGKSPEVPEDRVDLVEINHFHDDQGRPVFDQVIFYDWSVTDKRYQIRDWRLFKNQNQTPLKDTKTGEFIAIWNDFKNKDVLRKTRAKLVRETWTQYDPELADREFLPEGKRIKLREASSQMKKSEQQPQPLTPVQNPRRWFRGPVPAPAPQPPAEHGR